MGLFLTAQDAAAGTPIYGTLAIYAVFFVQFTFCSFVPEEKIRSRKHSYLLHLLSMTV